jgi:hypothetical protein
MKKVLFLITLVFGMFLSSLAQQDTTLFRVEFDRITVKEQQSELSIALENNAKALTYVGDALVSNAKNNNDVAKALIVFSQSRVERFKAEYKIEDEVWNSMIKREVTIRTVLLLISIILITIIATWMYKHRDRESHWQNILIRGSTAIGITIILYFFLSHFLSSLLNSDYKYYKELLTSF